jgi:hypothetical protein
MKIKFIRGQYEYSPYFQNVSQNEVERRIAEPESTLGGEEDDLKSLNSDSEDEDQGNQTVLTSMQGERIPKEIQDTQNR